MSSLDEGTSSHPQGSPLGASALGDTLLASLNENLEPAKIEALRRTEYRSSKLDASRMADQLAEAMSAFGIDGTHEVLRKVDSHGTMPNDLFASAAA